MTDKCNLHCKHCSVNNITAIVHPYHKIRREMQQLYDMGVRILFFCGGETFLWRDGERTALTDDSKKAFLIIESVDPDRADDLAAATDQLAAMVQQYLGADIFAKQIITRDNPTMVIDE